MKLFVFLPLVRVSADTVFSVEHWNSPVALSWRQVVIVADLAAAAGARPHPVLLKRRIGVQTLWIECRASERIRWQLKERTIAVAGVSVDDLEVTFLQKDLVDLVQFNTWGRVLWRCVDVIQEHLNRVSIGTFSAFGEQSSLPRMFRL